MFFIYLLKYHHVGTVHYEADNLGRDQPSPPNSCNYCLKINTAPNQKQPIRVRRKLLVLPIDFVNALLNVLKS